MKNYKDLQKSTGPWKIDDYRKLCFTPFPVMFTCTLQGFSGIQGNPIKFTAKKFAVQRQTNQSSNKKHQYQLGSKEIQAFF